MGDFFEDTSFLEIRSPPMRNHCFRGSKGRPGESFCYFSHFFSMSELISVCMSFWFHFGSIVAPFWPPTRAQIEPWSPSMGARTKSQQKKQPKHVNFDGEGAGGKGVKCCFRTQGRANRVFKRCIVDCPQHPSFPSLCAAPSIG